MTLLTVKQAKSAWCPFAAPAKQIDSQTSEVTYRSRTVDGVTPMSGCRCLANKCLMGWRWADATDKGWQGSADKAEPRGYCGFASKPT